MTDNNQVPKNVQNVSGDVSMVDSTASIGDVLTSGPCFVATNVVGLQAETI